MCWANKKNMCEEGPNEDPEILTQSQNQVFQLASISMNINEFYQDSNLYKKIPENSILSNPKSEN